MILKVWDMLFELIQIEVQCNKNYFKIFLLQEAGAFGSNRKWTAKAIPNFEEICILYIYGEYLLCLQSSAILNYCSGITRLDSYNNPAPTPTPTHLEPSDIKNRLQDFPYCGNGGSSPQLPKLCLFSPTWKDSFLAVDLLPPNSSNFILFNIYRMLFLTLKKIWMVKNTSPQVPTTWAPQQNLPSLSHWGESPTP